MDLQTKIAIIAACSALAGVIISQSISLLISYLDKRHKKHILLRQKYEEMMFHFQDSLNYYTEVSNCRSLDQIISKSNSVSAQRAMGLAMLYFPKFEESLTAYLKSQVHYYQTVISLFNPNIQATAGAQARVHDVNQIETVEKSLFKSKDRVMADLKKYVHKYTKA